MPTPSVALAAIARHDADTPHAPPRDVGDDQRQALTLDPFAHLRRVLEASDDIAAERLHGLHLRPEHDGEVALEIGEQDAAVDVDDATAPAVDRGDLLVGLVADLADDLLEEVLDGDQTNELVALRGDDRDRDLAGLHLDAEALHRRAL